VMSDKLPLSDSPTQIAYPSASIDRPPRGLTRLMKSARLRPIVRMETNQLSGKLAKSVHGDVRRGTAAGDVAQAQKLALKFRRNDVVRTLIGITL
jgi:hypothetical protein